MDPRSQELMQLYYKHGKGRPLTCDEMQDYHQEVEGVVQGKALFLMRMDPKTSIFTIALLERVGGAKLSQESAETSEGRKPRRRG